MNIIVILQKLKSQKSNLCYQEQNVCKTKPTSLQKYLLFFLNFISTQKIWDVQNLR